MTDPLLRALAALPSTDSDPARADRVRARCRTALTRRQPKPRRQIVGRYWAPIAAGLAGVYLIEVVRQAARLYGIR
jgi:hypothetical protein